MAKENNQFFLKCSSMLSSHMGMPTSSVILAPTPLMASHLQTFEPVRMPTLLPTGKFPGCLVPALTDSNAKELGLPGKLATQTCRVSLETFCCLRQKTASFKIFQAERSIAFGTMKKGPRALLLSWNSHLKEGGGSFWITPVTSRHLSLLSWLDRHPSLGV